MHVNVGIFEVIYIKMFIKLDLAAESRQADINIPKFLRMLIEY